MEPRRYETGLAGVAGLEPATPGFGDRCSSQLSYTPTKVYSDRALGGVGRPARARGISYKSAVHPDRLRAKPTYGG